MTPTMRSWEWREVKRRPVQGNSPNDRILRGPGCYRPKRVCADSFPATPWPQPAGIVEMPRMRFSGMAESIGPMSSQNQKPKPLNLGVVCRLPLVGTRAPVKERDGRSASCSSSADEFRPAIPRSGWSPPVPVSASPAPSDYHALPAWHSKTGTFYFAGYRNFLLCLDTP